MINFKVDSIEISQSINGRIHNSVFSRTNKVYLIQKQELNIEVVGFIKGFQWVNQLDIGVILQLHDEDIVKTYLLKDIEIIVPLTHTSLKDLNTSINLELL